MSSGITVGAGAKMQGREAQLTSAAPHAPATRQEVVNWFASLRGDELVLLSSWGMSDRFDEVAAWIVPPDRVSCVGPLRVLERIVSAHGIDPARLWDKEYLPRNQRARLTWSINGLEEMLDDCLSRRLWWWVPEEPLAGPLDILLSEAVELINLARRTPRWVEMATALAPSWRGSPEDLFACAAQLGEAT